MTGKKERVLFFDILRIFFIALIVYLHFPYSAVTSDIFFKEGMSALVVYPYSIGLLAVYGIIFVSGAVLELNYPGIKTLREYFRFIAKRCLRLYPAYWMSLIIAMAFILFIFHGQVEHIFWEFSGYYYFTDLGKSNLNQMGWFIGTILSLYLLFPILSAWIKRNPVSSMVIILAITYVSRYYFFVNGWGYRVWPVCNLLEFSLGIFCVQQGWYPRNAGQYPLIARLSDLSFYIFLIHLVVLQIIRGINRYYLSFVSMPWDQYYVFVTSVYVVLAIMIMIVDERIQSAVRARLGL